MLVDSLGLRTLRFTFKGSSIMSAACLHIFDDLSEADTFQTILSSFPTGFLLNSVNFGQFNI